jgi:hypothetical protein
MSATKPPVKDTPKPSEEKVNVSKAAPAPKSKPAAKAAPKSEQAAAAAGAAAGAAAAKNQPSVRTGIESAGERTKGDTPPRNDELAAARAPAPVEDVDKGITQRSDVAPQEHEKNENSDHDPEAIERQKAGKHAKAATQTKESKTIEDETRRVANLTNEQREALRDDIRNQERDETGVKIKGPIHRIGDHPEDITHNEDDVTGPANSQDRESTKEKKA